MPEFEPREIKYVILKPDRAIFLSPLLNHSDVVSPNSPGVPISAGMCRISWDEEARRQTVSCYGHSVSLNLKSLPEDQNILERTLNEFSPW